MRREVMGTVRMTLWWDPSMEGLEVSVGGEVLWKFRHEGYIPKAVFETQTYGLLFDEVQKHRRLELDEIRYRDGIVRVSLGDSPDTLNVRFLDPRPSVTSFTREELLTYPHHTPLLKALDRLQREREDAFHRRMAVSLALEKMPAWARRAFKTIKALTTPQNPKGENQ